MQIMPERHWPSSATLAPGYSNHANMFSSLVPGLCIKMCFREHDINALQRNSVMHFNFMKKSEDSLWQSIKPSVTASLYFKGWWQLFAHVQKVTHYWSDINIFMVSNINLVSTFLWCLRWEMSCDKLPFFPSEINCTHNTLPSTRF